MSVFIINYASLVVMSLGSIDSKAMEHYEMNWKESCIADL